MISCSFMNLAIIALAFLYGVPLTSSSSISSPRSAATGKPETLPQLTVRIPLFLRQSKLHVLFVPNFNHLLNQVKRSKSSMRSFYPKMTHPLSFVSSYLSISTSSTYQNYRNNKLHNQNLRRHCTHEIVPLPTQPSQQSTLFRLFPQRSSRRYTSNTDNDSFNPETNLRTSPADPYSKYTHQIAIPLAESSELHSALHAIQTSLVRDCPRLIRACVVPALLRLPLLYVDGSGWASGAGVVSGASVDLGGVGSNAMGGSNAPGGGFLGSTATEVDSVLQQVVHRAIRDVVYGESNEGSSTTAPSSTASRDETNTLAIGNPILLPFRGLELQGHDNSVLYAVGYNINDKSANKQDLEEDDGVYVVDDWVPPNRDSGWEKLEKIVYAIQNELETTYGLETCWPLDDPQGTDEELDGSEGELDGVEALLSEMRGDKVGQRKRKWRPRVPFVRLPGNFYDDLENDFQDRMENREGEGVNDVNEEKKTMSFDPVSQGIDGISPLFWYEAWGEEDILPPPGVRMRSIAVYRRMAPGGGEAENSFYVPSPISSTPASSTSSSPVSFDTNANHSLDLPEGDPRLMARERRERAKALERLGDEERRAELDWERGKARWMEEGLSHKLKKGARKGDFNSAKKLNSIADEKIVKNDHDWDNKPLVEMDIGLELGEVTVDGDAAYNAPWSERVNSTASVDLLRQSDEDSLNEVTSSGASLTINTDGADITNQTINSTNETSITTSLPKDPNPKRKLPSVEDNPVFRRLWKGQPQLNNQGEAASAQSLDGSTSSNTDVESTVPPYPSDPHFVGVWRIVSSPIDEPDQETFVVPPSSTSSHSSDNLIFRVDGSTMGGPILNAKYKHKAAGGTWDMFQAIRKPTENGERRTNVNDASSSQPFVQTRLRVRLLVPPEKERMLVMEGEVTRLVMPGGEDASSHSPILSEGWKMASGGLLDGMTSKMLNDSKNSLSFTSSAKGEEFLYCRGEAWMENAKGGGDRRKLGPFSLMKLKTPDRSKLIYTVPSSKGPEPSKNGSESK